jgi:predicted Zn-dependent protease
MLEELAAHYRTRFGIATEVAQPVSVPDSAYDSEREQLISDALLQFLRARHPQTGKESLVVIGVVAEDMYIPDLRWQYAISARDESSRYAVVSTARLDYGCLGLIRASGEQRFVRLRKMVTKNVGVLFFGFPLSDDPRSVLYGDIGGPQELDRMTEDF